MAEYRVIDLTKSLYRITEKSDEGTRWLDVPKKDLNLKSRVLKKSIVKLFGNKKELLKFSCDIAKDENNNNNINFRGII